MSLKIGILDDERLLIDTLQLLIEREEGLELTVGASSYEEFLYGLKDNKPDILLLDIRMPDVTGFEVLERMEKRYRTRPKVAFLTMNDTYPELKQAVSYGVEGYLLKGHSGPELLAAIQSIHQGKSVFQSGHYGKVVEERREAKRQLTDPKFPSLSDLSMRELDIIRLVEQGNESKQVAEMLNLSYHTIKTYRKNIVKKLGVKNMLEAISIARAHGKI